MSRELPTNVYYTYVHVDPRTGEIRYVGMGHGQRAWMMRNTGESTTWRGHRNKAHWEWFLELESLGYTLSDIVKIQHKNKTKEQALGLEQQIISDIGFDRLFNVDIKSKFYNKRKQMVEKTLELRAEGLSYEGIAKKLSLGSPMTAWRYING